MLAFYSNVTYCNVVSSWEFNETTGSTALDSSSSNNNGTLGTGFDTTTCWVNGFLSNALKFEGNSNNYVYFSNNDDLKSLTGSIAFWVKIDMLDNDMDIIHIGENNYTDYLNIRKRANGTILVTIEENDNYVVNSSSSLKISNSNWHYVTVTQDGTGIKIYIDGNLGLTSGTNSGYWTNHLATISSFNIGYGKWSGLEFKGLIDEVKIYDNALTAQEIASSFQSVALSSNWHFDENTSSQAEDSSYYQNDGTLGTGFDTSTCWTGGILGNALKFDGNTNNFVSCNSNNSLKSETGSIELWFKADYINDNMDIIHIGENNYANYLNVRKNTNGTIGVAIEDDDVYVLNISSTTTINDTDWHHIAITQDGEKTKIYIDGKESEVSGTNSTHWTSHMASISVCRIGYGKWSGLEFDGLIDEVKVHYRALNEKEVFESYENAITTVNLHLDESSGSQAEDSSTYSNDCSLGTGFNTSTCWVDGRVGNALRFDGNSDNYIIRNSNVNDLEGYYGTISFWIKAVQSDNAVDIIYIGEGNQSDYLNIRRKSDGKIQVQVEDNNVYLASVTSNSAINDTQWHHVAVAQDGTGIKIYIDGEQSTVSGTNSSAWTGHLNISQYKIGYGGWYIFEGILDEVKIYKKALGENEIIGLYDKQGGDNGYGCEGNPTGDPIGGGAGYSDILDAASADYVVSSGITNTPTSCDVTEYSSLSAATIDGWGVRNNSPAPVLSLEISDYQVGNSSIKVTGVSGQGSYTYLIWDCQDSIDLSEVTALHFWLKHDYGSSYPPKITITDSNLSSKVFTLPRSTGHQQWEEARIDLRGEFEGDLTQIKFENTAFDDAGEYIMVDGLHFSSFGLLNSLKEALSGEIVFINGDLEVNIDKYAGWNGEGIIIPTGVTVASDRGNSSYGALLYSNTEFFNNSIPIFKTGGADVRITGLRLKGPTPEVGVRTDYSSSCINSEYTCEVDNCEIYAWNVGVSIETNLLNPNAVSHVHHNYIHNNQVYGGGYGVYSHGGKILVEANEFDYYRHAISGHGMPGCGIEACYNLVGPNSGSELQNFDMHGEADYRKEYTMAIWRFDQDNNTYTKDSSVNSYEHHGSLTNFSDTIGCWVDGMVGNALKFDGTGYVDIALNNDNNYGANLESTTGSIEFWLKAAQPDNNIDIIHLGEGSYSDYLQVRRNSNGAISVIIEDDNSYKVSISSTTTIADVNWHHIVITQDGSGIKIYIDGQESNVTGTGVYSSYWTEHLSLSICRLGYGLWYDFDGILDEVRIYSEALNSDDVSLHNTNGHADYAADYFNIHHNTFEANDDDSWTSISIRGIPGNGADIYNNWFYQNGSAKAVNQEYTEGNIFTFLNLFTSERILEE
jgi:hypothetical protein